MKFKVLFITFNIVLFLSFLTIFLLPFFILDGSFMVEFWSKNWYFGLIFIAILAIVNGAFISNWKMLSCLEKEDWPALSSWLEAKIIGKKRYSKRKVRLLCDSLLLLGDFTTIRALEAQLRAEKPQMLVSLAVRFCAAQLLASDYESLHQFASDMANTPGADRDWLLFYAAFSRQMAGTPEDCALEMLPLARTARDPVVTAIAAYVCGVLLLKKLPGRHEELEQAADGAKQRVLAKYTRNKWDSMIDESKSDMYVVILSKIIDETTLWLYGTQPKA